MSADLLRKAAREMREKAKAATSGPWHDVPMGSEGSIVINDGLTVRDARKPATCREFADAEHIASWHPAVALAVADQLDDMADVLDGAAGTPLELAMTAISNRSVAVARVYLGTDA